MKRIKTIACTVLALMVIFANMSYSNAAVKPCGAKCEKQLARTAKQTIHADSKVGKTSKSKKKKAKAYAYWGGNGNADGDFKVRYKGNKLYLSGVAYKVKPGAEYPYGQKKTKVKKTVKIDKNCKISFGDETVTVFRFKNKKKVKKYWGKKGQIQAPSIYVEIKGNKAVWVAYGA